MNRMLLVLLLIAVAPAVVHAQTTMAVDIHRAELAWEAPADGGPVAEYRVLCGPAPRTYTLPGVKVNATTIPVASAIPGPGTYFCVVRAANQFGEGPPSNEIAFDAGDVPGATRNLTIRVQ